ncbi:MAG TPA: ATP phosphoribosyltransferase regulatory subunit [Clostridia bacterium]|jgi:ATP phosphoribosyltransferase regulatory subunit|nr:ATP phosphoribosyltransferase regulatory subunit [Clostridia bacterium]
MKKYDRVTPEGTRDYLFRECKIRRGTENSLRKIFEDFGYDEVMTTSLEFYDVFSDGIGKMSQNELYTLTDGSGRLITMRPDSTKPIARLFASRLKEFVLPIKLFYSQPVFKRNVRFNKKFDEVLQMGVELIGASGFRSDLEILIMAIKCMKELFGSEFYLEIGHMGVITSVLNSFSNLKNEAKQALAIKNFPDIDKLANQMGKDGDILKTVSKLFGGKEILAQAKKELKDNKALSAINEIEQLYTSLEKAGCAENVIFDFSVVQDVQYYTGLVFRGFVKGKGLEVMSGGRYDSLYSDYSLDIPAIGFAFNINETIDVLKKENIEIEKAKIVIFSENEKINPMDTELLKPYVEKGFNVVNSVCYTLEETIAWAKAIKAKKILLLEKDKLIEKDI